MSWLKFDYTTPEKPEVFAITSAMKWRDSDLTIGKLFKVWRWFDAHTTDGFAPGVSADFLDSIIGCKGFANAMANVGWLSIENNGLRMPNFGYHTGASAKDRAQNARRSAESKGRKRQEIEHCGNEKVTVEPLPESQKSNADTVTKTAAREEKRREEYVKSKPLQSPKSAIADSGAPGGIVFEAYSDAYERRYSVRPTRNATTNAQAKRLHSLLGDEAKDVARWYVENEILPEFQRSSHAFGHLLKAWESIASRWRQKRRITTADVVREDREAGNESQAKFVAERVVSAAAALPNKTPLLLV